MARRNGGSDFHPGGNSAAGVSCDRISHRIARAHVARAFHCCSMGGSRESTVSPAPPEVPWHVGHEGHWPGGGDCSLSAGSPERSWFDSCAASASQVPQHDFAFTAAACRPSQRPPANAAAWQQHSGETTPMSRATSMRRRGCCTEVMGTSAGETIHSFYARAALPFASGHATGPFRSPNNEGVLPHSGMLCVGYGNGRYSLKDCL